MFGPADKRVLMLTNIKLASDDQTILDAVQKSNYTEQLTWRDAATGAILAQSDFFEPLTVNSLTAAGLRRPGLLSDRGRQGLLHPPTDAGTGRQIELFPTAFEFFRQSPSAISSAEE